MPSTQNPLSHIINTVLRVSVWCLGAALALFMLLLALTLLLVGALWALLRGQRPTRPVVVGQWQRYAQARMWRNPKDINTDDADNIVDVQVREVPEGTPQTTPVTQLPPGAAGR